MPVRFLQQQRTGEKLRMFEKPKALFGMGLAFIAGQHLDAGSCWASSSLVANTQTSPACPSRLFGFAGTRRRFQPGSMHQLHSSPVSQYDQKSGASSIGKSGHVVSQSSALSGGKTGEPHADRSVHRAVSRGRLAGVVV